MEKILVRVFTMENIISFKGQIYRIELNKYRLNKKIIFFFKFIYNSTQEKQLFFGANLPSIGTGGSKEYPLDNFLLSLSNNNF